MNPANRKPNDSATSSNNAATSNETIAGQNTDSRHQQGRVKPSNDDPSSADSASQQQQ